MTSQPTRSALVCGSDVRLTEAIARRLTADGIALAVLATAGANADELQARTQVPVFSWDIGDYQACEDGIRRAQARLGPVDILVNGACVYYECPLQELTQPMWRDVIKVNLGGCFNLAKAMLPSMHERRFGRVVSIALNEDSAGSIANRAAAAGLRGFTRGLALEGEPCGVTANLVALDRLGLDEENSDWPHAAARAAALLCADDSAHITASMLTIDRDGYRRVAL